MLTEWEQIKEDEVLVTERCRVKDLGWLVRTYTTRQVRHIVGGEDDVPDVGIGLTFVPDVDGLWEGD